MHIVTRLEKIRYRMRMEIDEEKNIWIPLSLFRERPFVVGEEIDLEEYDNWLMLRQYRHALNKAAAYLTTRARSSKEVETYLMRYGYLDSTVEMVILKLHKLNYLDDVQFATQWIESRSNKALGKRRLQYELLKKGISHEIALQVLQPLDDSNFNHKANELAEKLAPRYINDVSYKGIQKLTQALVRRGFDWDDARQASESALKLKYDND